MLRQHQQHDCGGINCSHDCIGIQLPRHHVSRSNPTALAVALQCTTYLKSNRCVWRSVADKYLSSGHYCRRAASRFSGFSAPGNVAMIEFRTPAHAPSLIQPM